MLERIHENKFSAASLRIEKGVGVMKSLHSYSYIILHSIK